MEGLSAGRKRIVGFSAGLTSKVALSHGLFAFLNYASFLGISPWGSTYTSGISDLNTWLQQLTRALRFPSVPI
jgi:hypothetical protein